MPEIIPSILAENAIDFAQKVRLVEGATQWLQIDCLDHTLVPFTNFFDPNVIKTIITPIQFELHLMVDDPRPIIEAWRTVRSLKRVFIHIEAPINLRETLKWAETQGLEPGVAINPETPIAALTPALKLTDKILVMGVKTGRSGQKILPGTIARVQEIKKLASKSIVTLDGGVTLKNAAELIAAGVDRLAVTSAIYKSRDPKKMLKTFQKLVNETI